MEGICDAFLARYAPVSPAMTQVSIGPCSLHVARATSAELESRVYVLGLAQEMSKKNAGCVLLRRLLREPQHVNSQFKLSAGSPRRDKQGPIKTCVIA